MERESGRRSSSTGRERAIVSQTNSDTISMAKLGKLLRVKAFRIIIDLFDRVDSTLNGTELKQLQQQQQQQQQQTNNRQTQTNKTNKTTTTTIIIIHL